MDDMLRRLQPSAGGDAVAGEEDPGDEASGPSCRLINAPMT
jgi:hypothetical protein